MKKSVWFTILTGLFLTSQPAAAKPMLENYFECKTKDDVAISEVIAFKEDYEAAARAAGFDEYNVKVMFPIYHDKLGGGRFTWYGSYSNYGVWAEVNEWFGQSEWPARFYAIVECESSSFWRAID